MYFAFAFCMHTSISVLLRLILSDYVPCNVVTKYILDVVDAIRYATCIILSISKIFIHILFDK